VHNASTKQRLAALRRKFGIWTSLPRWARERRERALAAAAARRSAAGATPGGATAPFVPVMEPTPPLADLVPDGGAQATRAATPARGMTPAFAWTPAGASGPAFGTSGFAAVPAVVSEPEAARRRRGVAAGVLAAAVLLLLAWLALAPWLKGHGPVPGDAGPHAAIAAVAPAPTPVPVAPPAPSEAVAAPAADTPPAPAPAAAAGSIEIRPGDTLWDLAARHLGDPTKWPSLHQANRGAIENPDLIFPGQRIHLPAVQGSSATRTSHPGSAEGG
jgi:LysM repeat protein